MATKIITYIFEIKVSHYIFCSVACHFKWENIKSTHYGIHSVRYLGPNIWDLVLQNVRNYNWQANIKPRKANVCPWRPCKNYIARVRFIWSNIFEKYTKRSFSFILFGICFQVLIFVLSHVVILISSGTLC